MTSGGAHSARRPRAARERVTWQGGFEDDRTAARTFAVCAVLVGVAVLVAGMFIPPLLRRPGR